MLYYLVALHSAWIVDREEILTSSDASTKGLPLPVIDAGEGKKSPHLILCDKVCLCGEKYKRK